MTSAEATMLAMQILIFACGMAMLSHRFLAAYKTWLRKDFSYKLHLPGILGCGLMLFAILSASLLGWMYALATVVAGIAVANLYVYTLRLRTEAGLLGPVLAVVSMVMTLGDA